MEISGLLFSSVQAGALVTFNLLVKARGLVEPRGSNPWPHDCQFDASVLLSFALYINQ